MLSPDQTPSQRLFSGEFHHSLDEKKRVTVPAVWRKSSEPEEFFVVPDPNGQFLLVMPPQEFHTVSDRVNADPNLDPAMRRAFIRQFYSRARQCSTDRQGRILLPEEQCKQVGLASEAVLVGVHSRFEIWNPETWAWSTADETPSYQLVAKRVGL